VVAVATLVTDLVVSAVPAHRTGAAAGFVETTTELAAAQGIAVLGSVLAAVSLARGAARPARRIPARRR